jgi:hypothetical protein
MQTGSVETRGTLYIILTGLDRFSSPHMTPLCTTHLQ